MTKSVVVIGPFIGDLEQELFSFRPYAKYISSTVDCDNVYISSHFNRSFLYDWVPQENFIPVFESLTRDETKQHGFLHDDVTRSDYSQIIKYIKNKIRDANGRVEIEIYSPPYIKSMNAISIYQKEFSSIFFPKTDINRNEYIAFVSNQSKESEKVYKTLQKEYDIIVIGNMSNGIEKENTPLKSTDYFINGYSSMMNYISNAKLLVTNCPEWAIVGNLLKKHMVFWGTTCSQFKPDGIYGFDNYNVISVDVNTSSLVDMIKYKYERIEQNANFRVQM